MYVALDHVDASRAKPSHGCRRCSLTFSSKPRREGALYTAGVPEGRTGDAAQRIQNTAAAVRALATAEQSVDSRHLVPVVGRQGPPRLRLWEAHVADPSHNVLVAAGIAHLTLQVQ